MILLAQLKGDRKVEQLLKEKHPELLQVADSWAERQNANCQLFFSPLVGCFLELLFLKDPQRCEIQDDVRLFYVIYLCFAFDVSCIFEGESSERASNPWFGITSEYL